jgi:hypothetical protein
VNRSLPTAAVVALAVAACVAPPRETLRTLRPGTFLEAKGDLVDGQPVVRELDELTRTADDKADKVELTGPVTAGDGSSVQLLGHAITIAADTEFESVAKDPLAPFTPAAGDWVRIKARARDDGSHRARTVRQSAVRPQFKVTGEVRQVDAAGAMLDVGGIRLPVAQGVDLTPLTQGNSDDPLALFLGEDQKAVPFSWDLGNGLSLGGQAASEVEWNDEFDLNGNRDRDRTKPQLRGRLAGLWRFDAAGSYALAEVSFGRDEVRRQNDADTSEDVLELTRAFVSLRPLQPLQLLAGRQDFDEEREWLYDEVLDGVRGIWRLDRTELELGLAQGRDFAAEENGFEDARLLVANLRHYVNPDWRVGAYVLQRGDDAATDFEPRLFGLRSLAQPGLGLGHWLELGLARGSDGARKLDGYAFDVGGLWTFDLPLRPTLGAGIAFGSGARDTDRRGGYRQSGLQDNNAKLGGVTSLRYYGELLDPELANLTVTTLCASLRPFDGASISVLVHGYRQDVASRTTPNTELRTTTNGRATDLGREFDLVLGYRLSGTLTAELVLGRFEPGSAFDGETAAHILVFTTRLSF